MPHTISDELTARRRAAEEALARVEADAARLAADRERAVAELDAVARRDAEVAANDAALEAARADLRDAYAAIESLTEQLCARVTEAVATGGRLWQAERRAGAAHAPNTPERIGEFLKWKLSEAAMLRYHFTAPPATSRRPLTSDLP